MINIVTTLTSILTCSHLSSASIRTPLLRHGCAMQIFLSTLYFFLQASFFGQAIAGIFAFCILFSCLFASKCEIYLIALLNLSVCLQNINSNMLHFHWLLIHLNIPAISIFHVECFPAFADACGFMMPQHYSLKFILQAHGNNVCYVTAFAFKIH